MLKQICRNLGVLEKSPCQCYLQFAGFLNIKDGLEIESC